MKVLTVSTDVFNKGGISRYTRYQVRAMRELLGEPNVQAYSLAGPDGTGFEEPFHIDYIGGGRGFRAKAALVLRSFRGSFGQDVAFYNHIALAPIGFASWMTVRVPYWVNVHGLEIWSGMPKHLQIATRAAHGVISGCQFTKDYLVEHYSVDPDRVMVHPDCADIEQFYPAAYNAEVASHHGVRVGECPIILSVGRIDYTSRHKGHERIMQAMARLEPTLEWQYVVAGQGDYRPYLERRANELGIADKVRFVGGVPEGQLTDFYNMADVFVLVSEFGDGMGEGLPLVHLEAAACGKPVIAGNADGSAEVAVDGVTGFLVNPHDIDGLSDRIRRLISDRGMARRMGAAGLARVRQEFSYTAFRDRLSGLLTRYAA